MSQKQPNPNITETHNIDREEQLNLILAHINAQNIAEHTPPAAKPVKDDPYETFITPAQEYTIGDKGGMRQRPDFVLEDDRECRDVPWTW